VAARLTHVRSGAYIGRTTDGANDPDYCWDGLINGEYRLHVAAWPEGYRATGPEDWTFTVPFPGDPATYRLAGRRGPPPSATPAPTATGAPSATPGPTDTATATASPTASPTVLGPAGELCLSAFHDRDGSGFADAGEPRLAGRRLTVRDETVQPVREVLSRAEAPVCVRLAVGVYYARSELASGWVATSAEEVVVLVTQDSQQSLAFGQRPARPAGQAFLPFLLRPRVGTPTPARAGRGP
jgi:hypothetical protein